MKKTNDGRASVLTFFVVGCLSLMMASAVCAQTTWYVDDDAPGDPAPGDPSVSDPAENGSAGHPFDAIQEGIDAASGGDTVVVADGTYTGTGNRDLDYSGKAITVRSEHGFENCIIHCGGSSFDPHRGFYFHSGETGAAVLQGFTIQYGYAAGANEEDRRGAGICCVDSSSPTIVNNKLRENGSADDYGGGIYCHDASPLITGNMISENQNGISCYGNAAPTISENTIADNYRYGGIYCNESAPEITGNLIEANGYDSSNEPGGILCEYASPWIHDNEILGNGQAGIICEYGAPVIEKNQISGNLDGGIICSNSYAVIQDNVITENMKPSQYGGGILLDQDFSTITGNRIENNERGGIRCDDHCDISITGNKIKNNIKYGLGCYGNSDVYIAGKYHLRKYRRARYHQWKRRCTNHQQPGLS